MLQRVGLDRPLVLRPPEQVTSGPTREATRDSPDKGRLGLTGLPVVIAARRIEYFRVGGVSGGTDALEAELHSRSEPGVVVCVDAFPRRVHPVTFKNDVQPGRSHMPRTTNFRVILPAVPVQKSV